MKALREGYIFSQGFTLNITAFQAFFAVHYVLDGLTAIVTILDPFRDKLEIFFYELTLIVLRLVSFRATLSNYIKWMVLLL